MSTPSASAGRGTARRAQSTFARPLQLLRGQRQLWESAATRRSDEAGVVQVAVSSQPAQTSHMGEVHGSPPTAASSPPTDHGPDLGWVTTSHIDGRAGWWQSPCPDLARGRGEKPPGLLYNGLLAPPLRPNPQHTTPALKGFWTMATIHKMFEIQPVLGSAVPAVASFIHRWHADRDGSSSIQRIERRLQWLLIENPLATNASHHGFCMRDDSGSLRDSYSVFQARSW